MTPGEPPDITPLTTMERIVGKFDDQYRDLRLATYSPSEVERFLRENPKGFEVKRGYELLVACVLARCAAKHVDGFEYGVALPLSKATLQSAKGRPSLATLLEDYVIVDKDADIWIVGENIDGHRRDRKVQVTMVHPRGKMKDPLEELRRVLTRKMTRTTTDPSLSLVILFNETAEIEFEQFRGLIDWQTTPFGEVGLVGQFGAQQNPETYSYLELYPNAGALEEVQLAGFIDE